MKRIAVAVFFQLAILGLIAGGAMASDLAATKVIVPAEVGFSDDDIDAGAAEYTLTVGYTALDTITFTLSAGTFAEGNDPTFSCVQDADGDDADDDAIDLIRTDGGAEANFVTFTVPSEEESLISGAVCTLTVGEIADPASPTNLTVASKTPFGVAKDTTGTKTVTLLQVMQQFTASIDTKLDATIDLASERLNFDAAPLTEDTLVVALGNFASLVDDDGVLDIRSIGDENAIDAADELTITISGDFTGIDTIEVTDAADGGDLGECEINEDETAAACTFLLTDLQDELANFASDTPDDDAKLALLFTVDGETTLDPRAFTADAAIDFTEYTDSTLFSKADAGEWELNGYMANIPWLYVDTQADGMGMDSYVSIQNTSANAAPVTATISLADGTVKTVTLASVPANSYSVFWANNICTAAGIDVTNPIAVSLVITVDTLRAKVTASAYQKLSADSVKSLPVYHQVDGYLNW